MNDTIELHPAYKPLTSHLLYKPLNTDAPWRKFFKCYFNIIRQRNVTIHLRFVNESSNSHSLRFNCKIKYFLDYENTNNIAKFDKLPSHNGNSLLIEHKSCVVLFKNESENL